MTCRMMGQLVEFMTPDIVRITKTADGQRVEKQSLTVIAKPENVKVRVSVKDGRKHYRSSSLDVIVNEQS